MKPATTADVLVIGAGPAGLLAADRLAAQGVNVLLVDAGRHYTRRICPVDRLKSCNGCRGICNVISGIGGSIHYGDGVKLSRFPSGRRLAELLGDERAEHLSDTALDSLCGADRPSFRRALADSTPFTVKDYPVASLSSAQVRTLVDRLYRRLTSTTRVTLRLGAEITDLVPDDRHGFTARLRAHGADETVTARRVIAAVGRRGQRWWAGQIRTLGLDHTLPVPSVGLRFEAPVGLLRRGALVHDDFKTTLVRAGVKVKTFCYCAGPGGGRLKFCDYGDHTLLDGHVIPEAGASPTGNFALLAQLRDETGRPRDAQWIEQRLLKPYRALRDDRPGKPVLQWYPDWRDKTLTCTSLDEFTVRAGHRPSLTDYGVANLAGILPEAVHTAMRAVFEELMPSFAGHAFNEDDAARTAVIGLELESLWDELALTEHLETSLPGLYAAGDCSGLAQGILQAAVAGLAAADHALASAVPATTGGAA
ncbi:FAD-dependent oxidoreductase [Streptomyces sp. NPDC093707]|uniref:FAD-dependent oxidoreductase n=1 Tax=Streptomyces sp. NPDC093707 TaxID=3154984 RepID=UPI00344DD33F